MFDTFRKIYALLSPQRQKQLLWLTVGMFFMSFVELGLAGAVSLLGVALAAPESLEKIGLLWAFLQHFPSVGENVPQNIRMLILVLGMVCFATALKNVLAAVTAYWQNLVAQAVGWDIAMRIFDNYLYAPYVWHTQENPAELNKYLDWRYYISGFFSSGLQVCSQAGILLFLVVGAFIMAPVVSGLLYGVTACTALLVYKGARRGAKAAGSKVAELSVDAGKVAHSALHGIREVQIYGQQNAFYEHVVSFAGPTSHLTAKMALYSLMPNWFLETVGMLMMMAVVLLMARLGESVATITGTLTLMAGVSWRTFPALNKIVGGVLQLKSNMGPVHTLLVKYLTVPRTESFGVHQSFTREFELQNVSFRYPHAGKDALSDITMTISAGHMVGLVGLSGGGKSTLVGILTGLLVPHAGTVRVDGRQVELAPGALKIGYVPQNPYIIDATLAENVAFCQWGHKPDEERVRACSGMAAIDFLGDLPEGIHTMLGDRGMRLSGGQVQRVAIARALYGRPDILLFDEATSALDGAAEEAIQSTIMNLRQNMTIIVVAHRLTTVQGCDTLYWLEGGTVRRWGSVERVLPEYESFLRAQALKEGK